MRYEEPVFRPPSEARSLILQATLGCSNNHCAFCSMYHWKRFRVRKEEELFVEIDWLGDNQPETRRVFLADGDVFVLSTRRLLRILEKLYQKLPMLERVTAYACPQNFKTKSIEELREVRAAGLTMAYYGVESGDDEILRRVNKGVTAQEMVEMGLKPQEAGIDLSVTVLLGLGGPRLSNQHAEATARVLNALAPRYASALTLMVTPREPSFEEAYDDPSWRVLTTAETLVECRTMVANIHADGITFRSNHASNYLALGGDLQKDKQRLLNQIDEVLANPDSPYLRPEYLRGL
ncbi:MAG: radical SAM protein [Proteobacteria bacterium]|nr:radical SAM protein [Pseudomonadota bacterium]